MSKFAVRQISTYRKTPIFGVFGPKSGDFGPSKMSPFWRKVASLVEINSNSEALKLLLLDYVQTPRYPSILPISPPPGGPDTEIPDFGPSGGRFEALRNPENGHFRPNIDPGDASRERRRGPRPDGSEGLPAASQRGAPSPEKVRAAAAKSRPLFAATRFRSGPRGEVLGAWSPKRVKKGLPPDP